MATSRSIFKPEAAFDAIIFKKITGRLVAAPMPPLGKPVAW
jgi:hypothetical protein